MHSNFRRLYVFRSITYSEFCMYNKSLKRNMKMNMFRDELHMSNSQNALHTLKRAYIYLWLYEGKGESGEKHCVYCMVSIKIERTVVNSSYPNKA